MADLISRLTDRDAVIIGGLQHAVPAMRDAAVEIQRLRAALMIIAAYGDSGATAHLKTTGSYARFDEPGAVQTARDALEKE